MANPNSKPPQPESFFKPPNPLETVLAPIDPNKDTGANWTWPQVEKALKENQQVPWGAVMRYGKQLSKLTKEEHDLIFGASDPFEEAIPDPVDDSMVGKDPAEMEIYQDNQWYEKRFGAFDDDSYTVPDDTNTEFLKKNNIELAGAMQADGRISRPRLFFEQPKAGYDTVNGFVDKTTLHRIMSKFETVYLDEVTYPHSPIQNWWVGTYQPPVVGAEYRMREFAVLGFCINKDNAESLLKRIKELQQRGEVWGFPFIWPVGKALLLPMEEVTTEGKLVQSGASVDVKRNTRKRQKELTYRSDSSLTQIGANGINCFIFSYSCPNFPEATHQAANCLALIVHEGFADVQGATAFMEARKKNPREGGLLWPDLFTREMCNGIQLPPPVPSEGNQAPHLPVKEPSAAEVMSA